MKKKINLLLIIILATSTLGFAQNSLGGNFRLSLEYSSANVILTNNTVKGSPYYKNRVIKGIVYLPNKKTTEVLTLALNLEENQLIFEEGDVFKIFNPEIIKGISFQDEKGNNEDFFITGFTSTENGINRKTLLRVIYNGDIKMFALHTVSFDRGNFRDPVTNRTNIEYKESITYYIVNKKGEFTKTKLKMKNLLNAIGDNESEIKSFAKKNRIKGKNESDAFKILEYYDSLLKADS